ncbi:lysozyme C, milk isozyme-like [Paroedura picta]|uniref:lysozyme C, milk isozyme-like n=1 Tax=Paroedura picta TaxID=143630 RepID=UPI0040560421
MRDQGLVALFFLLLSVTEAKHFWRCELARTLKAAGLDTFGGRSVKDWVCLAYYESYYKTDVVGEPKPDGSRNYGIFQINSRLWCSTGSQEPNFGCKTDCSAFTDDDITDDIECAKKIASGTNGMNAWEKWKNHCRERVLCGWTRYCNL